MDCTRDTMESVTWLGTQVAISPAQTSHESINQSNTSMTLAPMENNRLDSCALELAVVMASPSLAELSSSSVFAKAPTTSSISCGCNCGWKHGTWRGLLGFLAGFTLQHVQYECDECKRNMVRGTLMTMVTAGPTSMGSTEKLSRSVFSRATTPP